MTSEQSEPKPLPGKARGSRHGMYKHGLWKHPLYSTWASIIFRCENPKCKAYEYYGGRGKKICQRWHDVAAFVADIEHELGVRPEGTYPSGKPLYSLDRADNDGHYSCGRCGECIRNGWPFNCRWATKAEQAVNRRTRRDSVSGYRGVCWMQRDRKWVAYIAADGRRKSLGSFNDPVEAARAYNRAALEAWGERAPLNPV